MIIKELLTLILRAQFIYYFIIIYYKHNIFRIRRFGVNKHFIITGNLYIGSNYIKTFFTVKPEMTALMADAIDNCKTKASTVSVPEVRIS